MFSIIYIGSNRTSLSLKDIMGFSLKLRKIFEAKKLKKFLLDRDKL